MTNIDGITRAFRMISEEVLDLSGAKAVFFAGPPNRRRANSFCRKMNRETAIPHVSILMLPLWKRMVEEGFIGINSHLSPEDSRAVRNDICRKFSAAASGDIVAFTKVQRNKVPHGTFFDLELPQLLRNEKVLTINSLPKHEYVVSVNRPDLLTILDTSHAAPT